MNNLRTVTNVVEPNLVIEGAGVRLLRSISPSRANPFDPFLLFDHFAFNDPIEGPLVGFPMHPHRGIETVTYMLDGSVHHRDSLGNSGLIGPGDVQWMTSGSGIMHEEMPRRSLQGNVFGFQLWVNLPAALKMSLPRYQEVNAKTIPVVKRNGVEIRVVAGAIDGVSGPVSEIAANPIYLDVQMDPASSFIHPIPDGHTTVAYIFEGGASFSLEDQDQGEFIEAVRLIVFDDGDHLQIKTGADSSVRLMLMAGAPFNEPIVPYGPFVMNTQAEIQQAFVDLRNGTFVKG
ncbi:MAG: pirin family protein [Anaerolineales bacterium]|jgi:hypothetical protein